MKLDEVEMKTVKKNCRDNHIPTLAFDYQMPVDSATLVISLT